MKVKVKKTIEKYIFVSTEGEIECPTLEAAENKVRNMLKQEGFAYVKKTILDENGKILEELYCG